jgi:hypothetical protein
MNILFENVNLARIEITKSNKMLVKCLVLLKNKTLFYFLTQ